ncbi:hypothetical protein KKC62_00085 [Patescibacteria group bacterium]|nr:hypothetical protein [Patescibacteria group bacterium]MBU1952611.1 hypothetical protein [Patescibacteria group bacterium]
MLISKRLLNSKVAVVILVAFMVLLSIFFLVLNKKHTAVSNPTLPEDIQSENLTVLGSKSLGQTVFYDNDGVVIGTSLNENLKPQVDITVDKKTVSKDVTFFVNTTKAFGNINAFFVNSWIKFIELVSVILDQIVS